MFFYRLINSKDHLNQKIRWPKLKCKSDRIMQSIDNDQIETEKDKWKGPNFMYSLKTGFIYIENQVWSHLKRSHSIEWTPSNQQQDEEEEEKNDRQQIPSWYTIKTVNCTAPVKMKPDKISLYIFVNCMILYTSDFFRSCTSHCISSRTLSVCVCVFFLTWQLNTRACLRSHSNSSFDFAWTIHHFVHRYKVVIHILRNILYFIYIYIVIFIQKCALFIWSSPIWNAANKTSLAQQWEKHTAPPQYTVWCTVYDPSHQSFFALYCFLYVSILHRQWRRCSFEMKNTK